MRISCVALLCLVALTPVHAQKPDARLKQLQTWLAEELKKPDLLLQNIEKGWNVCSSWTKSQQRLLQALAGGSLVLCSKDLTYTMLFVQSFRAVGWPLVKKGWAELRKSYIAARATFKARLPEMLEAREILPKLLEQRKEAEKELSKALAYVKAVQRDVREAQFKFDRAAKAIEKSLPPRKELERIAMKAQSDLPSIQEVNDAVRKATASYKRVQRQLALVEDEGKSSNMQDAIKALQDQKLEAEAALADAKAIKDKVEEAVRAAADEAMKSLPNAKELQEAKDDAEWAKKKVQERMQGAQKLKDEALKEYADLMTVVDDAMNVANSIKAVLQAVDPNKLEIIGRGIISGLSSCAASAASPTASTALVGSDVGNLVATKILPILQMVREFLMSRIITQIPLDVLKSTDVGLPTEWFKQAVKTMTAAIGMWVAHRAKELTLLASGAMIGARMVVDAVGLQVAAMLDERGLLQGIDELVDTLTTKLDLLDGVEDNAIKGIPIPNNGKELAQFALAIAGILVQINGLPGLNILKVPLAPVFAFETYLKGLAATEK